MDMEFAEFFAEHKDVFARQALNYLRNLHDADDALMDAALAMHRRWPIIKAHPKPLALARRMVKSKCIDFYRAKARRSGQEALVSESGYPAVPTADDLLALRGYDALDRALALLEERAPKQADCVRLRHLDGYEYDEIAEELRISVGAAKSNTSLGLKQLQAFMELPKRGEGDS
jgi:RNA polymerase sigma-70 factor (ECF subfamily)